MFKEVQINASDTLSFSEQLDHCHKKVGLPLHLMINKTLSDEELTTFEMFIQDWQFFPFRQISFNVDGQLIQNKQFINIIKLLNKYSLASVKLIFSSDEIVNHSQAISENLTTLIAPQASYPIQVFENKDNKMSIARVELKAFQNQIIAQIQETNKGKINSDRNGKFSTSSRRPRNPDDPLNKPIRLKELLARSNLRKEERARYIDLEVQHVETIEQNIAIEEVVELEVHAELQEIQQYAGELIGYREFSGPSYRSKVEQSVQDPKLAEQLYDLLHQELFANLPQAIKYLSPSAAEQLALNLPGLVSLNKENLPQGFLLKKTAQGEWVLDFDEYLELEKTNPFTPVVYSLQDDLQALYPLHFSKEQVRAWVGNDSLYNLLEPHFSPLTNMWIKYGDEAVSRFFERLNALGSENPQVLSFLMKHYLNHFPQWDHWVHDESFFNTIERINHFSPEKLNCLQIFMKDTGSSRHNLSHTIAAFDVFWNDLTSLCIENKVETTRILGTKWSTPKGGNPIVYMERMLFLLRNARNLDDQLKGLADLTLANYGAYYAARYEGFKSVAANMQFNYRFEDYDKLPFHRSTLIYREELANLISLEKEKGKYSEIIRYADCYENCYWLINTEKADFSQGNLKQWIESGVAIPFDMEKNHPSYNLYRDKHEIELQRRDDDEDRRPYEPENAQLEQLSAPLLRADFKALAFRFIGQQSSGITLSSFSEEVKKFGSEFYQQYDLSLHLLAALFFISHERYIGKGSLYPLLDCLDRAKTHEHVLRNTLNELTQLYKLDIKLNETEGLMLIHLIAGMNSAEFEGTGLNKKDGIEKLLAQLKHNKFAALKMLQLRAEHFNPKWPFIYALDTADFLAQDPDVASVYHDDLLLFSTLINSKSPELFHVKLGASRHAKPMQIKVGRVRDYFKAATQGEQPNNYQYAIQRILQARPLFNYSSFLSVCDSIAALPHFDHQAVDQILQTNGFRLGAIIPAILQRDRADLKALIIALIIKLSAPAPEEETQEASLFKELSSRSIQELQVILEEKWSQAGALLSLTGKVFLNNVLKTLMESSITEAFTAEDGSLLDLIGKKISALPDFQRYDGFEKVAMIEQQAGSIAKLIKTISKNPFVIEHIASFIELLNQVDFSQIDYESLFAVLNLFIEMPQRGYLDLAKTLLQDPQFTRNKEWFTRLIELLTLLNNHYFPSSYLDAYSKLFINNPQEATLQALAGRMIDVYARDPQDPILELLMSSAPFSYQNIEQILRVSETITANRDKLSALLMTLAERKLLDSFGDKLAACLNNDSQPLILEIIAKSHAVQRSNSEASLSFNYAGLVSQLSALSAENLNHLQQFYETSPVSLECLANGLQGLDREVDFAEFLLKFEKEPFGPRDLEKQFSTLEVERVINNLGDLINQTVYPYQYRKQLMEAFLFVNQIGETLPVYYNKAAKDLTNAEIKSLFTEFKENKYPNLTAFQRRLCVLGLMREAMYRSTGEFPYPTQMIALIDAMMHEGDHIANIDTGQGKSLIDSMKAALLYLDSDRVDLLTSSLVDAKRDIENYGPFFKSLGIPYSQKPISSSSPIGDFQTQGVNLSTAAQISLFLTKAELKGISLESPETIVSVVINESDYTILDDKVIYRYATATGAGISQQQEWIYYAINEFVTRPDFLSNRQSTAGDDIDNLKLYLKNKAQLLQKSSQIVDKFSDDQYLSWIESSLIVNYHLKENEDFVIPDEFEKRTVKGTEIRSKVVKILMTDDKVSPDSTFGNGMQQFLYARLNKERESSDFIIEPQNVTIVSSNNKNLLQYYRAKHGFIWGSSGTTGSSVENGEQYTNYGFEFTKMEPHQKNQVQFQQPVFLDNEQEQFRALIQRLTSSHPTANSTPHLVFFKDINTAKRFFELLKTQHPNFPMQLYTGLGKEEEYIRQAKQPGMITVTTSALGRNTDIHYDKTVGLKVWQTYVDSIRGDGQKSGRTGRQGSVGTVYYFLNKQELGGRTVENITAEIDRISAEERCINEAFYDISGYLFAQVKKTPTEHFVRGKSSFLNEEWSKFSVTIEAKYREHLRHNSFERQPFIEYSVNLFNQMMANVVEPVPAAITADQLTAEIDKKYSPKQQYIPCNAEVRLTDCVVPVTIAYHLLNFKAENGDDLQVKEDIKAQLAELFTLINTGSMATKTSDYLGYLCGTRSTQKIVVEAHKEFLREFLAEHSEKLNIVQRWLGYEGKLNQIASNQNYLVMFQAIMSIPHAPDRPIIELDMIKESINVLLDEYLENSWFISSERYEATLVLKQSIQRAQDIDAVVGCLSKSQTDMAKVDLATNKDRIVKPLHFFGHSRYQTVLGNALKLSTAFSSDMKKIDTAEMSSLLTTEEGTTPPLLTLDDVKNGASAFFVSGAEKVVFTTLENLLVINGKKEPLGMQGRDGFFATDSEDLSKVEEDIAEELLNLS